MDTKNLGAWANQVSRYIDLWHKLEMGTGTNETPLNRKERGSWRPPVANVAHGLWDTNRLAGSLIGPELDDLEARPGIGFAGHSFSDLLKEMRENPGAKRTWKQAVDLTPNSEEAQKAEAVWNLCLLVAKVLIESNPKNPDGSDYELEVKMHAQDEEANSPKQAAARDREAGRKNIHAEAHRRRVAKLRAIQERDKLDESSAIWIWINECGMSKATIKRSLEFVANEQAGIKDESLVRESFTDWEKHNTSGTGNGEAA